MLSIKNLKRVTDKDYLLCHRCGLRLDGFAHKECAEAARIESGQTGKESSKIKHPSSNRPFEGIGTIGHSPCRLDDGSTIIPIEEARKIREEGFVCAQSGTMYGPWTHGRLRETSRVHRKKEAEAIKKEIEAEEKYWGMYDDDDDDIFSLAHGYSQKIFLQNLFSSPLEIPDEEDLGASEG